MPAVKEVLKTVLPHKSCYSVIKSIPLSNDTVRRRIDEMSADVEHKLCNTLRNAEFSLQLDDSTLPGNESLLLGYVRFVHNEVLCEELAIALTANTIREEKEYFRKSKLILKPMRFR